MRYKKILKEAMEHPGLIRERYLFRELNPALSNIPLSITNSDSLRTAAVLIPIIMYEKDPAVLFTVRASTMPSHAGQISFPGGHTHPEDADHADTALREAHEEIGLSPVQVEIIGQLGVHYGGGGFRVTPVIGCVVPGVSLSRCAREVADIFEVPLSYMACIDNHGIAMHHYNGVAYRTYTMPFGKRYIWGLTAGISRTLCEALQG